MTLAEKVDELETKLLATESAPVEVMQELQKWASDNNVQLPPLRLGRSPIFAIFAACRKEPCPWCQLVGRHSPACPCGARYQAVQDLGRSGLPYTEENIKARMEKLAQRNQGE